MAKKKLTLKNIASILRAANSLFSLIAKLPTPPSPKPRHFTVHFHGNGTPPAVEDIIRFIQ